MASGDPVAPRTALCTTQGLCPPPNPWLLSTLSTPYPGPPGVSVSSVFQGDTSLTRFPLGVTEGARSGHQIRHTSGPPRGDRHVLVFIPAAKPTALLRGENSRNVRLDPPLTHQVHRKQDSKNKDRCWMT